MSEQPEHMQRASNDGYIDPSENADVNNNVPAIYAPNTGDKTADLDSIEKVDLDGSQNAKRDLDADVDAGMMEATTAILTLASKAGSTAVNSLLNALRKEHFDVSKFLSMASSVDACRSYLSSCRGDRLAGQGFQCVQVNDTDGDNAYVAYTKNIVDVLQKQVSLAQATDFMFRPDTSSNVTYSQPMNSPFFGSLYNKRRSMVLRSSDPNTFWVDTCTEGGASFVGFLQIYSDKTAMTLKSNAMVAYPVHVVFLNTTTSYRRWLIDNGHTIVAFLPVQYYSDPVDGDPTGEGMGVINDSGDYVDGVVGLSDSIRQTSDARARIDKLKTLHAAMSLILKPLQETALSGFTVSDCLENNWYCFPLITSYCCDIPESKDISGVKHGGSGPFPCVRCKVTPTDIVNLVTRDSRSMEDTLSARRTAADNKAAEHPTVSSLNLSEVPSFLEHLYGSSTMVMEDIYSMFTFESLHNLHLGVSKQMKQCLSEYFNSSIPCHAIHQTRKPPRPISSYRMNILRAVNSILATIEKDFGAPGLHIDFSKHERSTQLNGLYVREGLRGMLEGKNYRALDMVFPIIVGFLERCLGFASAPVLTDLHVRYSELMLKTQFDIVESGVSPAVVAQLKEDIHNFKQEMVAVYGPHSSHGLYTLKFHLLDHLADDIGKYGNVAVIDASAYEGYNTNIKSSFRQTSRRRETRMSETVDFLSYNVTLGESGHKTHRGGASSTQILSLRQKRVEQAGCYLVRDGLRITFSRLKSISNGRSAVSSEVSSQSSPQDQEYFAELFPGDSRNVFLKTLHEKLAVDLETYHDADVHLEFVKSGFVQGGFTPDLTDYVSSGNYIAATRLESVTPRQQRIFATSSFGPTKQKLFTYVLITGEVEGVHQIWVARLVALFHVKYGQTRQEYAFLQYMQCVDPVDAVDSTLKCICLRWATTDEVDHTTSALPEQGGTVCVGEWYDIVPVDTIVGAVHVVRSNFSISPFTSVLPWSHHRFYVNRFYRYR